MISLQVDDLDGVLDRLIDDVATSMQNAKAMTSESLAGSPIRKEIVSSFGRLSQLTNAEPTQIGPHKSAWRTAIYGICSAVLSGSSFVDCPPVLMQQSI
jgi:hypothetical protein